MIDTVDDTVNETIDGVTKSTDAITPDFVKKTKENRDTGYDEIFKVERQ